MIRKTLALAALACCLLVSACGSRSVGNKIDDQFLEPSVRNKVQAAHADLGSSSSHLVVVSYNGVILLAGQTPRPELKELADKAARSVLGVKQVHNELQILQPTSALARSNDTLLTSRLKTSMLAETAVPSTKIKIVTENGVVFLLGLITRQEGDRATRVAQSVSGVQKVVKLFQYVD
jgi:osmotically-inducible protein OsmY